jgi:23S rRNA (uracil1939-C5)-methyltransferase
VNLRILKARNSYYEAQLMDTVKKSPLEQDLPAHYQVYGGCKWLPIAYPEQLRIKSEQVRESFHNIEKYWDASKRIVSVPIGEDSEEKEEEGNLSTPSLGAFSLLERIPPVFHDIVPSPEIYGYRNKVEFSWGKYISEKE